MLRNILFISLEIVGAYEDILIGDGIIREVYTKALFYARVFSVIYINKKRIPLLR